MMLKSNCCDKDIVFMGAFDTARIDPDGIYYYACSECKKKLDNPNCKSAKKRKAIQRGENETK